MQPGLYFRLRDAAILGVIAIMVGVTGNALSAKTMIRSPRLPSWIDLRNSRLSPIHLDQRVSVKAEKVRVCRVIKNVSAHALNMPIDLGAGDASGQLSTFTFDGSGAIFTDHPRGFMPGPSVPPPPPNPDGSTPSLKLDVGAELVNCTEFAKPKRRSFSVVSLYFPNGYYTSLLGTTAHYQVASAPCFIEHLEIRCGEKAN
jgi:hypothetical protein